MVEFYRGWLPTDVATICCAWSTVCNKLFLVNKSVQYSSIPYLARTSVVVSPVVVCFPGGRSGFSLVVVPGS